MEKCNICGEKVGETFLNKINGTIIKIKKDGKNEKKFICNACQKEHRTKLRRMIKDE